jgi:hypothetical protein
MKKTKEGTVDGNLFWFLKVVTRIVCLLEGYGGSGNDGAKLGGFNVWWPLGQWVVLLCLMEFWQWWKLGWNNGIQWKGNDRGDKKGHFSKVKRLVFQ